MGVGIVIAYTQCVDRRKPIDTRNGCSLASVAKTGVNLSYSTLAFKTLPEQCTGGIGAGWRRNVSLRPLDGFVSFAR
jgi:hypothetical protein